MLGIWEGRVLRHSICFWYIPFVNYSFFFFLQLEKVRGGKKKKKESRTKAYAKEFNTYTSYHLTKMYPIIYLYTQITYIHTVLETSVSINFTRQCNILFFRIQKLFIQSFLRKKITQL